MRNSRRPDRLGSECSCFFRLLQSPEKLSSDRQTAHGTTCLTAATREAFFARSSALVASASDPYTPEKTIQYPGWRLAYREESRIPTCVSLRARARRAMAFASPRPP